MTKKLLNPESKVSDERKFRDLNRSRNTTRIKKDPNFEYRWVRTDVDFQGAEDEYDRIDQFTDKGYSVVYSEDRPEDERTNSLDNTTKNSDRLKPVTKRTRSGVVQVLMKCSKEQRAINEKMKAERDEKKRLSSVKSIKRQGNEEITVSHEVGSKLGHLDQTD